MSQNNGQQILATSPSGDIQIHMGGCSHRSRNGAPHLILRKTDDADLSLTRDAVERAARDVCAFDCVMGSGCSSHGITDFVAVSISTVAVDNLPLYCRDFLRDLEGRLKRYSFADDEALRDELSLTGS